MPVPHVLTALLGALDLCRQELPPDTHPIYRVRLDVIELTIRASIEAAPREWEALLARREAAADSIAAQREERQ